MPMNIVELQNQVVPFFGEVFNRLFTSLILPDIASELDRKRVARQIEELADTASGSLSRFLSTKELSKTSFEGLLKGFRELTESFDLERIANPN